MAEALAVVIGVGFLHVFFRAVESQWPASYFALSSGPDYAITRLFRYLAFRLLPVFVVSVFAAATLKRDGRAVILPVVAIGVIHALLTSGRALLGVIRSGRLNRRPLLGVMHATVMLTVVAASLAGSLSADAFDSIVPGLDAVSSDLWTGLIAGVIGAYAVRVTQAGFIDTDVVFTESRRAIPRDLWGLAADLAERSDADPRLVRAVMLTENIQRPGWFRRLERIAALVLRKPASLGLLQTAVGRPSRTRNCWRERSPRGSRESGSRRPMVMWIGRRSRRLRALTTRIRSTSSCCPPRCTRWTSRDRSHRAARRRPTTDHRGDITRPGRRCRLAHRYGGCIRRHGTDRLRHSRRHNRRHDVHDCLCGWPVTGRMVHHGVPPQQRS